MKKVAVVTLYYNNYNFGGQLQAYAMQNIISKLGCQCDLISYNSQNKYKKIKVLPITIIFTRFYHKLQMKFHKLFNPKLRESFNNKSYKFQHFMKAIPHTNEIHNNEIITISTQYDYWITGSDQVWNPENYIGAPLYLLKDVKGKKISYAASSYNSTYSKKQVKEIREALGSFSAISVREKSLSKVISYIIKKPVTTVLDPTFLLTRRDWDKIAISPLIKKKYAFVYLLHFSDKLRKNIYTYCKKHGLIMVIVPHVQGWYKSADEKYYDIQATEIGPAEWIGYIKNAEIVFTDSFHGTVFSVIYHKNFLSFENITGDAKADSGLRKYSILEQLELSERCVPYSFDFNKMIVLENADYGTADLRLELLRKKSRDFLETALEVRD